MEISRFAYNEASNPQSLITQSLMPRNSWFLTATLLFVALTAVPTLLGYLFTPPNTFYTGLIMNPEDAQSYFAKMQQGLAGSWVYTIPFAPEPHDPAFVGGFYLFLGHLARWLGLSLTAVYHTARLFFAALLFLSLPPFIRRFLPSHRAQKSAFLLAILGSGFGWLLFLLQQPYWLDTFPIEFKQPEAHLFFTAMTFPHMALATTLLLWYMGNLAEAIQEGKWSISYWLIGGSTAILLGITAPFLAYVLLGLTMLTGAWLVFREKRPFFPTTLHLTGPLACAAPLFAYYAYILQINTAFHLWDEQALTPAAPWPHYLVAYGLFVGLALLLRLRQSSPERTQETDAVWLLWLWLLTAALLLFLPVNQPRRFVQGIDVPLSILVTLSLKTIVWPRLQRAPWFQRLVQQPRYSKDGLFRLLFVCFLAFVSLSNFYLLTSVSLTAVLQQPDPLFRPLDEQTAVLWLREQATLEATVLGASQTGNFVAGQGGQRVMLGHWAETGHFLEKETAVQRFFQAETSNNWRQDLLQQFDINYIWHGPRERALGDFVPDEVGYLTAVYHNKSITIYKVNP